MFTSVYFSLNVHFCYVHVNETNILRHLDPQQEDNNEYQYAINRK